MHFHSCVLDHANRNGLSEGCQNNFVRVHVLPRLPALRSGRENEHLWGNASDCSAIGTISNELDLVLKDYQRLKEDLGQEAVT
ncbi:hypothetical protein PIB30_003981 [Stylosanthes scabra]|uniref:Uncharacterized protein n=1 Tax=Stylosanthes scabra TaxID=79078 RepID=A0ABU6W2Y1_9FABA|nr:hypothetical protein [Stylosanthes scabra]